MIAAVGIALSSQAYVQKNTLNVAILRCFGASQKQILWQYTQPLIVIGLIATCLA
jgi:putative ABC transport system permease protein